MSRGRVMIVSASIGAGHDGAAREWARRLEIHGFDTEIHDVLTVLPAWVARSMREGYRATLERNAWIWSVVFALTSCSPASRLVSWLSSRFRHRLRDLVPADAVAVVATYPLASQMLGTLRRRGELAIPAMAFLTDLAVHPLCVSTGLDVHYVVQDHAARAAVLLGAGRAEAIGPLVHDRFAATSPALRAAARERFGLPAEGRLALLVAGSWGVGDVERAAREIAASGAATPVIACGQNTTLRDRIGEFGLGHPLGWVDDMHVLMRGVDVLVENAGGLTSLEAMASGLPVATYRPIAGHGRANAAALERAGLTTWIRTPSQLDIALTDLFSGLRGHRQVRAGHDLFATDPVGPAVQLLERRALSAHTLAAVQPGGGRVLPMPPASLPGQGMEPLEASKA